MPGAIKENDERIETDKERSGFDGPVRFYSHQYTRNYTIEFIMQMYCERQYIAAGGDISSGWCLLLFRVCFTGTSAGISGNSGNVIFGKYRKYIREISGEKARDIILNTVYIYCIG